jgi:hypothetical protein
MKAATIEITFRKGRRFAAYLRLEGPRANVTRTSEAAPLSLIDYDDDGRALGLEILTFDEETISRINEVLGSIGHPALSERELAPLRAA